VRITDVLSHIDEGELIALTRDLVRIPSVVRAGQPDATEAAVAAHVEQWLRRERFEVEVQEVAPGRPNVLGVLGERQAGPTLLLEGHTDVVTEGDATLWTRPPFGGDLVKGRL
jgi:succinyl-diaminopimelate desuccinylase